MTLRSRLVVLFGLVALFVSLAVGALSYRATNAEVEASTDKFLEGRAADFIDGNRARPQGRRPTGRGGHGSGNAASGAMSEASLSFDPDAIVQVTTSEGEVVGTSGADLPITGAVESLTGRQPATTRREVGVFDDVTIEGEAFRMYTRTLPDGGVIQVARSTTEDDDVMRSLLTRFALIALAATLAASLLGWWLARRTTRPLRRLADVASTVADTRDFSVEVPVERSDEIGMLAVSMRTMLAALESSRDQQQRLVHDASHELRTPLTSLRANVAMLERIEGSSETVSPEDRKAVLDAIAAELGELGALFEELIDLATDNDTRDTPLEPVRLDEVAIKAVSKWQQRTDREIELVVEQTSVWGDPAMLERAVTNLIGNAHKFSPPDEPIDVVVRPGSVSVRDAGPGIPIAERKLVFDRFHRAATTRTMPGSGLGLSIVAEIVDHHGGEVWAGESDRGGADVGFRVPLLSGHDEVGEVFGTGRSPSSPT